MKCQCCKERQAEYAWQPFGPGSGADAVFTLLGSHYRGFPAMKVCSVCKEAIRRGDPVQFTYKGTRYAATNRGADATAVGSGLPQPTKAGARILTAMEGGYKLSVVSQIVAGEVVYRAGWLNPSRGRNKYVPAAAVDTLLKTRLIVESKRYLSSEGTTEGKPYQDWHVDYQIAACAAPVPAQ